MKITEEHGDSTKSRLSTKIGLPVIERRIKPLIISPKPIAQFKLDAGLIIIEPPAAIDDTPSEQLSASIDPPTQIYSLIDIYTGRRIMMHAIGLDIGTKTIVLAFAGQDGKTHYLEEINGYWPFDRATPFIENLLNDPNKIRADGSKRPARWIKMPDTNRIIVLGKDAEEFAYAKNDTLLRPMAEGGIASDTEAMIVLSAIVQGLISMVEKEIGMFGDEVKLMYCTTAASLNKSNNIEYHKRVVNIILDGYETKTKLKYDSIKESHAIVLNMSTDATGIGISWGAGTVTVSYVKQGIEVFSFAWVGAGDWIDEQVATRHGYNPERSKMLRKTAKETPTTIARRKTEIDLTPGKSLTDRVDMDIVLHYDILISDVVDGIVQGFVENESQARIDNNINIYMAGGTSSPPGFSARVKQKFAEKELPFSIGEVKRAKEPLLCVAEGCLTAANIF